MSFDEANELLGSSGGAPAARFEAIGDTVKGRVVSAVKRQQTDFATREPKFWPDGNPKWQIGITVATDDGDEVCIWAKGQMLKAIRDAVAATGGKLEPEGILAVRYDSDEDVGKGNPMKVFVAQYKAPAPAAMSASELI